MGRHSDEPASRRQGICRCFRSPLARLAVALTNVERACLAVALTKAGHATPVFVGRTFRYDIKSARLSLPFVYPESLAKGALRPYPPWRASRVFRDTSARFIQNRCRPRPRKPCLRESKAPGPASYA